MDAQVIQRLMADVPEMQAFRAYLAEEALKLNSLDGLAKLPFAERADEVTARLRAFEKIADILQPLINTISLDNPNMASDYAV